MDEKIYTIPVNEAFEQDCECPLCYLHSKLESEGVEYALGAAMMEPDYRIVSNEMGYCRHHYSMMFAKKNKLSLALVLETHLEEIRKKIDSLGSFIDNAEKEKKSFFKKSTTNPVGDFSEKLSDSVNSCVICDKLSVNMTRYVRVMFYLWEKDEKFREKILNSKGFCLPHFNMIVEKSFEHLNRKKAAEFSKIVYEKEVNELSRIQEEIHRFTQMFDYRNKDAKWGSEIDAPLRTVEKLAGHILK